MENKIKKDIYSGYRFTRRALLLLLYGAVTGIIVGLVAVAFHYSIAFVTEFRVQHDWIIWGLPFGGLVIVYLYHLAKLEKDPGTNRVLTSLSKGDPLPLLMAPLIFIGSVITHLFGGSSGREGAALQIGGSIAYNGAKFFHLTEEDQKILTMCGMSAAFSALFGTPLTATLFAIEVQGVGQMFYGALLPAAISALTAFKVAGTCGLKPDAFYVAVGTDMNVHSTTMCLLLSVLIAGLSVIFCQVMHKSSHLYAKFFPNPYVRIFVGGCLVAAITFLSGTRIYNGAGMHEIEHAMAGNMPSMAFIMKLLLTALTLSAGYKGGEIVPALYVGAAFGCLFANIFGLHPSICAATGMGALFCGVTNCPVASLMLCFELFGFGGMVFYLLAIAMCYTVSGYYSLYSEQIITYSKFHNRYVHKQAK